jgi:hypothetical protein
MYPNDFINHVTVSLRRQAEEEKERFKEWLLTALERLEAIRKKLAEEESR